jgi:hypothetical protein
MNIDMKRILAVLAIACATAFQGQQALQDDVPAYHAKPPAKGEVLPLVLTQKQLADAGFSAPVHLASYKAAGKAPAVMYQMPCYCHCDKGHGHTSLHSCFETTHGAGCGTCMAEALYAYQMSKKGSTAKMIRDGIIRGDYKTMDLQHPDPVN